MRHAPRRLWIALAASAALAAAACARHAPVFQDSFLAMDSVVEISVAVTTADSARAAFAIARREVERLDAVLSDYRPDSNVGRLNARATDHLEPETRELLERSQVLCRETGGGFDACMRPIKRLWGFGTGGTPHVPDSLAIAAALAHTGCEVYSILPDGRFVWRDSLAQMDFGGIAQGFVGRVVRDSLRAHGFDRVLINISGDVVASGGRRGGKPWRVGIQHPRRPDSLLTAVNLAWSAVTTSGDYEQYFDVNGVHYHHIFDPHTGRPARGLVSVTVFCDDPVLADCMTKAVFTLGPTDGLAWLNERDDLRGMLVQLRPDGGLQVTWSDGGPPP